MPAGESGIEARPVLLVTGVAGIIGRAIALEGTRRGWAVAGTDLLEPAAWPPPVQAACGMRLRVDLRREEEVARAIAEIVRVAGRIDGLVSNAGIMVRRPVEELDLEDWRRVIDTNLTAAFLLAKHAASHLRRRKGAIVAIASTRAHMSEPETEAYAASKGGLVALTHALALSLAPDVRVNCVSPGWIADEATELAAEDHAQHPAGRVGTPADVARLVGYLLSADAGFITGSEFIVDGGMTRKMIYL